MHKGRIVFAAALATIGLGLSACGADEKSPPVPAPAPTTPSAPSSENAGDASAAPVGGDVTAPGTKLKIGERAVLPFEYTETKKGTIAVTVTAIEKGTEADMAVFGDKIKGFTPYYIKMKVENVGGTDLSHASLKLKGVLEGGTGTGVVLIDGIRGKCDNVTAPAKFTTKGASYETCSLSAAKGKSVTAAGFDEGEAYSDSSVVWTG